MHSLRLEGCCLSLKCSRRNDLTLRRFLFLFLFFFCRGQQPRSIRVKFLLTPQTSDHNSDGRAIWTLHMVSVMGCYVLFPECSRFRPCCPLLCVSRKQRKSSTQDRGHPHHDVSHMPVVISARHPDRPHPSIPAKDLRTTSSDMNHFVYHSEKRTFKTTQEKMPRKPARNTNDTTLLPIRP